MILRSILLLMIPLTTLLARPAAAADPQGLSPAVERFLERETWNRLRLDSLETDADPRYLPAAGRRFEVEYAWIPESAIHVQDSGLGSRTLRDEIFRTQGGRRHFRFIIHPESKEAYAPLLKQFPIAGKLMAIPTASTRTLYVWDPARPKSPGVFAKLTLDRKQTALGRAVADWEVRRSVRLTQAADQTPSTVWKDNGSILIPEIAGAYVSPEQAHGSYIDNLQHTVFRHGMIYRDASWIEEQSASVELYPLFSIFAERGSQPPLIVEWWKRAARARSKPLSFIAFLNQFLTDAFVEKMSYLIFEQGIIPDTHAQNLIIAVDPTVPRIQHFYHRDVGSMKVSFRLRIAHGLSIDPLKTQNAAYDFKPEWAEDILPRPFYVRYWRQIIGPDFHHDEVISPLVGTGGMELLWAHLKRKVDTALTAKFPGATVPPKDSVTMTANDALLKADLTALIQKKTPVLITDPARRLWAEEQLTKGQWIHLPTPWANHFAPSTQESLWDTAVGIIVNRADVLKLILSPESSEARQASEIRTEWPAHSVHGVSARQIEPLLLLPKEYRDENENLGPHTPFFFNGQLDTFPVYRAGSAKSPLYYSANPGFNARLEFLQNLSPESTLAVEILDDWTGIAPDQQHRLLNEARAQALKQALRQAGITCASALR